MAHEVFVSHATEDRELAGSVCRALEEQGIVCWMAPRDIPPGTKYGEALVRAIDGCRVLLLLLSNEANQSEWVYREIERAASKGRRIVTVRLADLQPAVALELFVSGDQWFDAFGRDPDEYLPELVGKVQSQVNEVRPAPGTARAMAAAVAVKVPAGPPMRLVRAPDHDEEDAPARSNSERHGEPAERHAERSVDRSAAAVRRKVALVYKRRAQPDDQVLAFLEAELNRTGHTVFIDRHLTIGMEWAAQIEREIKSADAVVPLLSRDSVGSEMVSYEVQIAHQTAQVNSGKPKLLPVRINFEDRLPNELAAILDRVQYFAWAGPQDNARLAEQLLAAIDRPPGVQGPTPESTGGAVPLDSKFYIERPTDALFRTALERRDSIILLNGARQMGKTSLLARGLQKARSSKLRVLMLDYQKLTAKDLGSLEQFYQAIGDAISDQLDLDADIHESWKPTRSPNSNFERFFKREVLGKLEDAHLLWAMDEVDRLFTFPYSGEVFGLFRAWHNERALDPSGPWGRLTLAIAYATEAHLFITDPNQSPFNVGTRLALEDFNPEQVAELNARHGSPVQGRSELDALYELIGGQPYLNHRGMNEMVSRGRGFRDFAERADRDDGPFGDHLRRLLVLLAPAEGLTQAVRDMVAGAPCPTSDAFFRLRGAGMVSGTSKADAKLRCGIYATYLRRHLT